MLFDSQKVPFEMSDDTFYKFSLWNVEMGRKWRARIAKIEMKSRNMRILAFSENFSQGWKKKNKSRERTFLQSEGINSVISLKVFYI